MNVLIVDDSATMRRIISNVVLQTGIPESNIYQAENGMNAIKVFNENNIDLILTDWNMPIMNGLDFVKTIRERGFKIPIIMITTEGGKGEVITALKAGVNNYIVKPFGADVLKEKMKPFMK